MDRLGEVVRHRERQDRRDGGGPNRIPGRLRNQSSHTPVFKVVDEGKVYLDTPLSKCQQGYLVNDGRVNLITASLVFHTPSGLPQLATRRQATDDPLTPDERFTFSGEGFVNLRRVVEKVTERPFLTRS
jgi:hypothetical protein